MAKRLRAVVNWPMIQPWRERRSASVSPASSAWPRREMVCNNSITTSLISCATRLVTATSSQLRILGGRSSTSALVRRSMMPCNCTVNSSILEAPSATQP